MQNNQTLEYYEKNADAYVKDTVSVDFTDVQNRFMQALKGRKILDFGCGSGRETKVFFFFWFNVFAFDGSVEMCKLASKHTGIDVKHMLVQDIDFEDEFDGIWAYASLLHVPSDEMESVLLKLKKALKSNGIFCAGKFGKVHLRHSGKISFSFIGSQVHIADNIFKQIGFNTRPFGRKSNVRLR